MTTLNTIIEEEKKEFAEKIDTICKQADLYQTKAGYPVNTSAKTLILSLFIPAMQRAYKAGREKRDTYWKERVGEIRLLIAKYAKAEDMDVAGLVNEINTLCK